MVELDVQLWRFWWHGISWSPSRPAGWVDSYLGAVHPPGEVDRVDSAGRRWGLWECPDWAGSDADYPSSREMMEEESGKSPARRSGGGSLAGKPAPPERIARWGNHTPAHGTVRVGFMDGGNDRKHIQWSNRYNDSGDPPQQDSVALLVVLPVRGDKAGGQCGAGLGSGAAGNRARWCPGKRPGRRGINPGPGHTLAHPPGSPRPR